MNNKNPNKLLLFFNLVIGILIIISPTIITGHLYDIQTLIGNIRVAEFVLRTAALIIGLLVINEGIKNYFKN
ncbi:hypothetical protein [Bacillus sp. EAC]|uniref:hypothetical protein n=1 Tax=Bacillus sp. EAC TaxID=1978338 RepID=UPI000B44BFA5|nr:hypothetical protein [Bacillus sp. EAC]